MTLVTGRRGPSLHVHVSSALPPGGVASTALHGEAPGPPQNAMQLEVACKCLRVSFWDDERRIILGPAISGAPGAAPEQEALCLYLDGVAASAMFLQPLGEILPTSACPSNVLLRYVHVTQTLWQSSPTPADLSWGSQSRARL